MPRQKILCDIDWPFIPHPSSASKVFCCEKFNVNLTLILAGGILSLLFVWFLGQAKYLVGRTNEWVVNPLGPGQTSALNFLADPFCYMQ